MKINCDMAEGLPNDTAIMPFIDMANIACGLHAGDALLMAETIALAQEYEVSIGAHISYDDRQGFGRRDNIYDEATFQELCIGQLQHLAGLCQDQNCRLSYVKPHGAMYNAMMADDAIYRRILQAVQSFNPDLVLVIMAVPDAQPYKQIALDYGIRLDFEAFVDRAYTGDGRLMSRTQEGAVFENMQLVAEQADAIIDSSQICNNQKQQITLQVDTICIHGDNPIALDIAAYVHQRLMLL
ncbi:MAG: LamB/YcsF family protein [Planctomycetes bacterium]|nr:LamB/YcsF family protein [Planctomycetota bacterium]